MTSLLCVQSLDGSVEVHDRAVADDLKQDIDVDHKMRAIFMPRGKVKKTPLRRPVSPAVPVMYCDHSGGSAKSQGYLKKPDVDAKERSREENNIVQGMYVPLLETENTFVKDMGAYLSSMDLLGLRKRELLLKTWNDRVYEPLRHKIIQAMNSHDWKDTDRRRRELYRQYLEHVNRKGHVFLETMDPGEYYAQALNSCRPSPITVHTPSLKDPLLAQGRDRSKEDQVILRCSTGQVYSLSDIEQIKLPSLPLVPLGRHGTNSLSWLEMPLGNIESTPRKASRLRMKGNCTDSQIDFGQWSKLPYDSNTIDQEMKLQKKRMFEHHPPFGSPPQNAVTSPPFVWSRAHTDHKEMCPVDS